jgi:hypothetical protein
MRHFEAAMVKVKQHVDALNLEIKSLEDHVDVVKVIALSDEDLTH